MTRVVCLFGGGPWHSGTDGPLLPFSGRSSLASAVADRIGTPPERSGLLGGLGPSFHLWGLRSGPGRFLSNTHGGLFRLRLGSGSKHRPARRADNRSATSPRRRRRATNAHFPRGLRSVNTRSLRQLRIETWAFRRRSRNINLNRPRLSAAALKSSRACFSRAASSLLRAAKA